MYFHDGNSLSFFQLRHATLLEALSVHPSIHRSVGPSERVEKWENKRFGGFLCMCLCLRLGAALGLEGGWLPLPNRPQLVALFYLFKFSLVC